MNVDVRHLRNERIRTSIRTIDYYNQTITKNEMAKNLVIVESPAKAKTINKYLGKDYLVKASIGHIKDLPSKGLGVDVDDDFKPTYEVIPDSRKRNNKKIVAELKQAAKEADAIYFAADPDREGEAICQHLAEEIVPKRPAKPTFRVMFNEITKRAVNEALIIRDRSMKISSTLNRRDACWIGWLVTRFRRCSAGRSGEVKRRPGSVSCAANGR